MASSSSSIFHNILLLLILFHLLLASSVTGFRVGLKHVPSGKTPPKYAFINPSINVNGLPDSLLKTPMTYSHDLYLMNLAIGTPPVSFSAIMDTGSNLIWTKCKTTGLFDPNISTSFFKLDDTCKGFHPDCKQKYENGNSVSVSLGQETLTVGGETISNITFACGIPSNKLSYDGIIGMGPGELSLVSQLKERVFSYCLGSRFVPQASSVLLAGSEASSIRNTDVQTVPLVTDESNYYIALKGISVGETRLPIENYQLAISNQDGGMVVDSGTTFTYLEKSIVDMISNEFMNQTRLEKCEDIVTSYDLQHCFKHQGGYINNVPNVVFHFDGGNWELGKENYIYEKKGGQGGCLGFIANNDNDPTIFGNMQQQNMMVIYDLEQKTLSFKHANCNEF